MWKKVANRFYFWQESNLKKLKKKKSKDKPSTCDLLVTPSGM